MNIFKKYKKSLVITGIVAVSFSSISLVNDYFEISKNLEIFSTILKEVNLTYVDEVDNGKLIKKAIDSMLEDLDPYTNYIPESKMEDYEFMITGQYGGVGALIRKNGDYVIISEPYKDFPADKAGLLAGDKLLKIDGKSVKGKSTSDVSSVLKGEPNTEVEVLIERPGVKEPIKVKIKREEIKVNSVPYYGMLGNGIGYINLSSFTSTASKELIEGITKLKEQDPNLKGLVFDLRGNPGGLLHEAVNTCNIFIDKGQEVVSTKGKLKSSDHINKTLNTALDTKILLVILIDRGSASASEIVSGTMQDLDRGVVLGRKSYGKGLVQTTRTLAYKSKLKITTAKYYIPSGRCIQARDYAHRNEDGSVGVMPDSLMREFKTKNGRKVFDGGGITPDVKVERELYHEITGSLISKSLVFDYATEFVQKNKTIAPASEFYLSDAQYADFVKYVKDKDYSYTTDSEDKIDELKKILVEEKYYEGLEKEFNLLQDKIKHDKATDLEKHKAEIKELLEAEIATRYYYQKGRIASSLKKDVDVAKAIEILGNTAIYQSILKGTYKAPETKK